MSKTYPVSYVECENGVCCLFVLGGDGAFRVSSSYRDPAGDRSPYDNDADDDFEYPVQVLWSDSPSKDTP